VDFRNYFQIQVIVIKQNLQVKLTKNTKKTNKEDQNNIFQQLMQ
jgi:hypothetical protein